MGTPTGSLSEPASPRRMGFGAESQAKTARTRDVARRRIRSTRLLPIWTESRAEFRERFLRAQRRARPGGVVRLITGRGRSGGGAPIRTRVRGLLRGLKAAGAVVQDYTLEESEGSYLVLLPREARGGWGEAVD